jgi:hypothetical protein
MTAKKLTKKQRMKQISAGVEILRGRPCAVCAGTPDRVIGFTPSNPESFGAGPDQDIFVAMCAKCFDFFDPDFLEAHLLKCGVQKNVKTSTTGSSGRQAMH